MSKKIIGKILIILGILIAIFGIYLLDSREKSLPPNIDNRQDLLNKQVLPVETVKNQKTTLEINGIKYESEIQNEINVYDFMSQLKNEGKINFKDTNYTGMGKFITEINGIKNNGEENWIYYVNNIKAQVGVSNYQINSGDIVSWKYE